MSVDLTSWPKQTKSKTLGPCAECRRRKLKCQRTYPCQNCENLGRADACLQSAVVKGTRSLKPSQVVMQEDLTVMSVRKEMLEAALAELQATISSEPHPLLVTDSQIRTTSPVPGLLRTNDAGSHEEERDSPDATDELVQDLGMMSIGGGGKTQYHGDTASSEFLVKENDRQEGRETVNDAPAKRLPPLSRLPPEVVLLSTLFPFPPKHESPVDMDVFLDYLPPYDRAFKLVQNYFARFCWNTQLLTPSETMQGIFGVFYPACTRASYIQLKDAHRLAVLFMIFLLGTLYDMDLDIQKFPVEAEEFHSLARAALVVDPFADNPTVHGVQGLALMIWYFRLFPGRRSSSYQWSLSGVLAKLVIATGLHRDHSSVISDLKKRVLYELTFWECHSLDIWQSFMYGRPTSLDSSEVDCMIPHNIEVPHGHDPEFFPWKYSFTMLVSRVVAQVSNKISYSDLLKYDKMLKDHYTPESLTWPPDDAPLGKDEPLGKTFQRYIMRVWKNVSIMYIHRRLTVQTIVEHKEDAVKSPFWYSVVSTYKSAAALTRDMLRMWMRYRQTLERMGPFWSHAHSAALVLCALVSRIPRWECSEDALRLVDETYQMFSHSKNESLQPSNALGSLQKHQSQAHYAFRKSRTSPERGTSLSIPARMDGLGASSLSPSESHFRFDFGESPTPIVGGPAMRNGTSMGENSPSPTADDPMSAGDQGEVGAPSGTYGATPQEAHQWGQYLKDMGVQY